MSFCQTLAQDDSFSGWGFKMLFVLKHTECILCPAGGHGKTSSSGSRDKTKLKSCYCSCANENAFYSVR